MRGLPQALRHAVESLYALLNERFVYNFLQLSFRRNVIFLQFKGLLKGTRLQFYQIAIVPMENSNLHIGMGNFANNSHAVKMVGNWVKTQSVECNLRPVHGTPLKDANQYIVLFVGK